MKESEYDESDQGGENILGKQLNIEKTLKL